MSLSSDELKNKIAVVIPAYNEGSRIAMVIRDAFNYSASVIVVNDCSRDNTSVIARENGAIVIDLPSNKGAGYATRAGCDLAVANGLEIIVTIDADGQHDPADIPNVVDALINEKLDIVFGCRPRNNNMPFIKRVGSSLLSDLASLLYKSRIEDTQTGFHAFTKQSYHKVKWYSSGYSFASEMVYKVFQNHLSYKEVPVKTIYKEDKRGVRKRDGFLFVTLMILWRIGAYNLLKKIHFN